MIDHLIGFSIRNKLIIGIFTLALAAWGIYSLTKLPIDAVPDITNNQVQVITTSPTLAAQEVEQFITYPVEQSMATIPDVIEIRSISRFGLSVVTVVFKDEVEVYQARQLVFERIKAAEKEIPAGLGAPEMAPITTGLGEIYQYVLHPQPGYEKKYDAMELRTIQDWIVKRQLLGTPGVADVSSFGGFLKQYQVSVSPERLVAMNVTITDIFNALQENNSNTGGAYIEKEHNASFIRGIGQVKNIEDIEKILIKNVNGVPLLIRDVAKVEYGSAVRYGAFTRNGEGEVVGGIVMMLKGENSAKVIEVVKAKIATVQKSLPEGLVIEAFLDRTKLVDKAIGTVSKNLIEGGLIVVFILVLLLGNFRASLVVASVIPLAMLFAISMMNLFGVSGNLMSLGAIDFGLIVDGAVIIVESIVHRIHSDPRLATMQRLNQTQMDDVVLDASVKIRKSAAFGEIIILIVYLPILALVGIEGKMFKPMAQTVSFAILGALILSLTYVPMMSALFLSKNTHPKRTIADRIMDRLQKGYDPIIRKSLRARRTVVIFSAALLAISLVIFSRMGGEFIPTLNEGDLAIESSIAPGSSLSQSVKTFSMAEELLLKKFPHEVKEVISKIGTSEIPTDPMPIEAADITVILKDQEGWTAAGSKEELIEKMEEALSVIPGLNAEFTQPIQLRFNELMTGVKQDIAVKIYGEDLDILFSKANEAAAIIRPIAGVGDLRVEQTKGLPQILVVYHRGKIAQYGLSIDKVNRILNSAFAGATAGIVYEGQRRFDMVVRFGETSRSDIKDVENLFIPLDNGSQIPLREVATVEYQEGAMQISRDDTKRRITIGVNVRDRDVESLVRDIRENLETKLKLPAGYYLTYGGQFENLLAAKARLLVAVPVALALIFILLFFTFGSFRESLLIFTAIPMAAIGGIFALLIRDMPFSISAGVGFIALFGVAVLNGIVLISYFNQLKASGVEDIYERVLTGTRVRLRPVILTATVASLGFLPMALSGSEGAEVQRPLATVVIGGLVTSTLLTLIVIPVLYTYMEGKDKLRINPSAAGMILLICFFALPNLLHAQIPVSQSSRILTAAEAVTMALEGNPGVKAARYEVENQKALQATSFNLSKTNIGISYGQYNSVVNDNAFIVSQDFAFPTFYTSSAGLAKQRVAGSEQLLAVTRNQLAKNVKLVYYRYALSLETLKLLYYQDSLYAGFVKAADLRFKTGETAYLEKIAAETRSMEIQSVLFQAKADSAVHQDQLQKLLMINEPLNVPSNSAVHTLTIPADTSALIQNPYLSYLKQQIRIYEAQTKVEKAALLPDFSIGITSQTLKGFQNIDGNEQYFGGSKRFEFVNAGVAIPLWFAPQKARIQSAKIGTQIAEANYQQQKIEMESGLQTLTRQYLSYQNLIQYYQQKAIPQSDLMISFSAKSYKAGEIGYIEFLQNTAEALQIKMNYLEMINRSNETIIDLEFIAGGQTQ